MKRASTRQPDTILIRDLVVDCTVGTQPRERARRRRVVLNLALACDLSRAGRSDDLQDTVDYAAVCRRVAAEVRRSRLQLIEALAQRVAETCLDVPGVCGVRVTLDKPGAVRGCRSVAVEISAGATKNQEQNTP